MRASARSFNSRRASSSPVFLLHTPTKKYHHDDLFLSIPRILHRRIHLQPCLHSPIKASSTTMTIHSHDILSAAGSPFIAVGGVTCQSEADRAVSLGARGLIFDFVPGHLHRISAEHAARISSVNVARMGRFVAGNFAGIRTAMKRARLDFAVLYGVCNPVEASWELGRERIVRAFSAATVTQEEANDWTPHSAAFIIGIESEQDAARLAGLEMAHPWIIAPAKGVCAEKVSRSGGIELLCADLVTRLRDIPELLRGLKQRGIR